MIKSFKCKETERIFNSEHSKKLPDEIQDRAVLKLIKIDSMLTLDELLDPPGNHLKRLSHDRLGQYSIRINGRWRVCFIWCDGNAYDVEIVDYH